MFINVFLVQPSKSKRKVVDISKDVASPTSSKQSPVVTETKSKAKSTASSKPTVKKINPVLAKAATIPIPPLNNTPQSIAIAAAANAVKAKLAAEQKAASENAAKSLNNPAGTVTSSNDNVADTSRAISAAVKAAASGVSTITSSPKPPQTATSLSSGTSQSSGLAPTAPSSLSQSTATKQPSITAPMAKQLPSSTSAVHSSTSTPYTSTAATAQSNTVVNTTGGVVSAIGSVTALLTPAISSTLKRPADDTTADSQSSEPSAKKSKPN